MQSLISRTRFIIICLSIPLALALSVGGAAAASSTASKSESTSHDIEHTFRLRESQLQGAASQIAAENVYADQLAATIASLQQQGKDVTDLVNGLARFRGQIATSQTAWQTANTLLTTHTGFDAQDMVVDKGQANWTVGSAHTSLQLIKQTATNAKDDLNDLLHRYGRTYDVPFSSHAAEDAF